MGMELAIVKQGSVALTAIDPSKVNLNILKEWSKRADTPKAGWAGDPIVFKKGVFYRGFKKDLKNQIKNGTTFVANVANVALCWIKWENQMPTTHSIAFPALGQMLCDRKTLGDNDPSAWELDSEGKAQDPWKTKTVIPMRKKDDIFHFTSESWGGQQAWKALLHAYIDAIVANPENAGKLPIVSLDFTVAENKKMKRTWQEPVFNIVGWTEQTPADMNVAQTGEDTAAEVEAEEPEITPPPAPAKKPASKIMASEAVDADDDEAVAAAVAPAPAKKPAAKKPAARTVDEFDV